MSSNERVYQKQSMQISDWFFYLSSGPICHKQSRALWFMSLIHVGTQLVNPVFNLALNVLHFIFPWPGLTWPWIAKWVLIHLPGSQLPRERALSWCSSECYFISPSLLENLDWKVEGIILLAPRRATRLFLVLH